MEKNCDKVDWKEISGNRNIIWTIPMLQKFSKKLDWNILSENIDKDEWLTEAHLEAFKDKWNWSEVTKAQLELTEELIEKYKDYWDWNIFIDYYHLLDDNAMSAIAFYEKYKEHLPMTRLHGSSLLRKIVDEQAKQIKSEILS